MKKIGEYKINKLRINLNSIKAVKVISIIFLIISAVFSVILIEARDVHIIRYIFPFILLFSNIFMYYILECFIEFDEELRIKSLSAERMKNELNLWEHLEKRDLETRKILHDYSNNLLCIKGLLDDYKINELGEFVSKLFNEYELTGAYISTGNSLIDVLINAKYEQAYKKDVSLVLKLDDLSVPSIENKDLLSLLANLLDNAIEACEILEEKNKEVFLSIRQDKKLTIIVRNPIEKELVIMDNLIKSTKKGDNHGLGLLNVKSIVEKYGGEIFMDVENYYFTYFIEI